MLVKEGDVGREFMVIMKGTAEVSKKDKDGNSYMIKRLDSTTSRMIGEAALINEYYRRSATVTAVSDETVVLVLTRNSYHELQKEKTIEQKSNEKLKQIQRQLMEADEKRYNNNNNNNNNKKKNSSSSSSSTCSSSPNSSSSSSGGVKQADQSQALTFS